VIVIFNDQEDSMLLPVNGDGNGGAEIVYVTGSNFLWENMDI
jgi:hypothetical protein